MHKSTLHTLFIILVFAVGCEVTPAEINYGTDSCHFCKMTIVDQSHAAQIVTQKGRSYKYDAIECMIQSSRQWDSGELKFILITDYISPKKLIDATSAYYLISENIPSPMGAYLSGFEFENERNKFLRRSSDRTLSWNELKQINF
ncbi:MAG: nitrous oxide reductase accessory protein NosL [Reichenbachiella sp.]|uniref:nitrous oxide reductase accessory protein NosL n=1 Tax=Reichenbachiella sp. TaxID=2184521 RepID=UPI003265BB0F